MILRVRLLPHRALVNRAALRLGQPASIPSRTMMCPSPEALGPGSRRVPRRRYADPPAGALLTGLGTAVGPAPRRGGAPATALFADRLARSILCTLVQMSNQRQPAEPDLQPDRCERGGFGCSGLNFQRPATEPSFFMSRRRLELGKEVRLLLGLGRTLAFPHLVELWGVRGTYFSFAVSKMSGNRDAMLS